MNARERFRATIEFQPLDRPFRWEVPAIWDSTIRRWQAEGMPEVADINAHFGMDELEWLPMIQWTLDPLCPPFAYEILEDDGVNIIERDVDGIIKKQRRSGRETSMPQFIRFPAENRQDYKEHILWRLNPATPERFPENWAQEVQRYQNRTFPLGLHVIGPFGHLRNLMGDEQLMYTFFDDPDFIREIMLNWLNFYLDFLGQVFRDVVPDMIMIWEDMCYKCGPLIPPSFYREYLLPPLKQLISFCQQSGVPGIFVDNDGDCSMMIPIYLEAGANGFYPFECRAGMDIVKIRDQYGPRFVIIGGIEKYTLSDACTPDDMRKEIYDKVPAMLESGGYIPMLDHSAPPNISYSRFLQFLEEIRNLQK